MQVREIHVEASTYCNARCPLCPRNLYGLKVEGVYPEVHLSVDKFKTCLSNFPERDYVYFNGNLGDPMMNPRILELADVTSCRTGITTNGSVGKRNTWEQLAKKGVEVTFSIDGLQDTNHLYRQDVSWSKIMERVSWFIEAGGEAVWKFIIFKHNAHQVEEARSLSRTLGFKMFHVEDHGRNYGPALDTKGNITHWIFPADNSRHPGIYDVKAGVQRYRETRKNFFTEDKVYNLSCEHETRQSVYIDALGNIGPCCYQGFGLPDMPFQKLETFESIKKTWTTKNCNWICAMNCSS